jgi:hypothetical protein
MALGRRTLLAPLVRWASRRRFPVLLALVVALLVVDVVVPDPIPLIDEALLGLGAILIGRLRRRGEPEDPPEAGAHDD